MRLVPICLAMAAVVAVLAAPSLARTVTEVIELGGTAEGTVTTGKATTVGVLIPVNARKVSISLKAGKKSELLPTLSVFAPDGTEITPSDLEAADGKLKVKATSISIKGLPAATSGLYKFVVRGSEGTAGEFSLKSSGNAAKFPKTSGSIDSVGEADEYRVHVPDGSFLTITLTPAKKSELVPVVEVRTLSGRTLDLTPFLKQKKAKTTVKKLPLPFFGGYVLRVTGAEGTGGYVLKVKTKTKKIKPDDSRPDADAGDVTVLEPRESTDLAGTGSAGVSFAWERVSGTGADLVNPDTATPSFTAGDGGGTHAFQLVTTLAGIDSIASTAVIEVNQPPVAIGGPSLSVAPGAAVALDGSESFDLDSDADLEYSWSQASGPSVTLTGATSATPTFTAPSGSGVLVFELVVSDGSSESVADRVVVGVERDVADAGRPVVVSPGDAVWLSGLRTPGDPDGFAWTRVDTNSPSITLDVADAPIAAFAAPPEPGIYRFRLEVAGAGSSADEVAVIVTGLAGNDEPRAHAGGVTTTTTSTTFELSGGTSDDPDDDTLSYEWRQISGTTTSLGGTGAARTGATPATADVLGFLLMVNDGLKYGPPDLATVVGGSPALPVADAGLDAYGSPGDTIELDSTGSFAAPGRSIASRSWTQLTGLDLYDVVAEDASFDPTAAQPSFTVPGTISSRVSDRAILFAVTVTDDADEESEFDIVLVTFTDLPANASPKVTAESSHDVVRPGTEITLTGKATDSDGDMLTYSWQQTEGGTQATLTGATAATATLTAPSAPGSYAFTLTVSDGTGLPNGTGSATARFTVNTPPAISAVASPPNAPAGTMVTLDGSGTVDPDGDTLVWEWMELPSALAPVPLTGADTSKGSFSVPPYTTGQTVAQRTRTFRLTVRDALGAFTRDVTFISNATPTTAGMTINKQKIRYDNTDAAVFTLPGLVDADGDTITVVWRIVSGPAATGATLTAASGATTSLTVAKPNATNASTGGLWVVGVTVSDPVASAPETLTTVLAYPSFVSDTFPILVTSCATTGCHTTPSMAGGLDLSTSPVAHGMLVGIGANNPQATVPLRVTPNDHLKSWLWVRVNNGSMPQTGGKLAAWQINIIRDWIEPEGKGAAGTMSGGAENN